MKMKVEFEFDDADVPTDQEPTEAKLAAQKKRIMDVVSFYVDEQHRVVKEQAAAHKARTGK